MMLLLKNASERKVIGTNGPTLFISNQKNSHRGQLGLQQKTSGNKPCMMWSLVRRHVHIKVHNKSGNAMICSRWDNTGKGDVIDGNIRYIIKYMSGMLDYPARRIHINRIGTYLLATEGAYVMKLCGHKESKIIKQGRSALKSTMFLSYTKSQFLTFKDRMAQQMIQNVKFTHIEGHGTREDLHHLMDTKIHLRDARDLEAQQESHIWDKLLLSCNVCHLQCNKLNSSKCQIQVPDPDAEHG